MVLKRPKTNKQNNTNKSVIFMPEKYILVNTRLLMNAGSGFTRFRQSASPGHLSVTG